MKLRKTRDRERQTFPAIMHSPTYYTYTLPHPATRRLSGNGVMPGQCRISTLSFNKTIFKNNTPPLPKTTRFRLESSANGYKDNAIRRQVQRMKISPLARPTCADSPLFRKRVTSKSQRGLTYFLLDGQKTKG